MITAGNAPIREAILLGRVAGGFVETQFLGPTRAARPTTNDGNLPAN